MALRDVRISRKLGGAFTVLIAMVAAVFIIMFWTLQSLDDASAETQRTVTVAGAANRMMASLIEQENALRAYSTFADPSFIDVYKDNQQAFSKNFETFVGTTALPLQKDRANQFLHEVEGWQGGVVQQIMTLAPNPATREQAQRLAGQKSLEHVRAIMKDINGTESDRLTFLRQQQAAANAFANMALIAGGLVAVITAAVMGWLLSRAIATPIARMTVAMDQLARGDMTADVPNEVRQDEIGMLAKAMLTFRDQLVQADAAKQAQAALICDSIGAGLDALSNGDLTARIDAQLTGPFAKLKTDFNRAMEAIGGTITAVSGSTAGIRTGATEISQASDDLSRRTEQQAASLEETAAAMDEITATVRETASGATRANQVVAETRADAEEGGRIVRQAVEAMGGIERASNEISEIITVIDGIAFQTNLLALNAGVEAARAGDAGRGFAVVASEVRALAQRSAEAAKDVKTKIMASAAQVESGVSLVDKTGGALDRIVGRIAEINQLVAAIASSAEQQASGLQQVNTAIGEMDSVTQQNAAMVEESTAAARSLAAEAEELSHQVTRFRLASNQTRSAPQPGTARKPAVAPVRAATAPRKSAAAGPMTHGALALKMEPDTDDWSQF